MFINRRDPLHIRRKLLILALISLAGMGAIIVFIFSSISTTLYEGKKDDLRRLIDSGTGIISYFHDLETSGKLSREQAQQLAIHTIAAARYSEDGYLWINNMQGVVIMHPLQPELDGKNMLALTDREGRPIMREFIHLAKNGGGWLDYDWPKPSKPGQWFHKLSYVTPFKPWHWVIGAGLYLDEAKAEVEHDILDINAVMMITLITLLTGSVTLIAASIYLSGRFLHQLEVMAVHDPLTSLHTRRYLFEAAPILLSEQERNSDILLAAIFFDIDLFKEINDNHGHACGDEVLAMIGEIIRSTVRAGDLTARYGGEEFVVLMLCRKREDATRMAQRIRKACHAYSFSCGRHSFTTTLSAGIAFRLGGESLEKLLQRADRNLYQAKENGRDRVIV